jgi:hypothetical protein
MSTSYSRAVEVRHFTDCVQTGCRGHKVRIIYHNTSDTLSIEIDGEKVYTLDPNIFEAAIEAHKSGRL